MTKEKNGQRTLADIGLNERATVAEITAAGAVRQRFLDLGIVRGTAITPLYKSPFGDPVAFLIRGTVIALRLNDCRRILTD